MPLSRRDFLTVLSAAATLAALPSCDSLTTAAPNPSNTPTPPDRFATLKRHNPRIRSIAPDSVLSVGNGNFAFNVDCTGLQSLPSLYNAPGTAAAPTIPLATLSHWAWHSKPLPAGLDPKAFTYKQYNVHGRNVPYATSSANQTALFNYLRENPHRLNLARIGLLLDGKEISPTQLANIDQTLDLATGIITSRFDLLGTKVEVVTCCHPEKDGMALRISSALLAAGKLTLQIAFPYGSSAWAGDGGDWSAASNELHFTMPIGMPLTPKVFNFQRTVDATRYAVHVDVSQTTDAEKIATHRFQIAALKGADHLETSISFDTEFMRSVPLFTFKDAYTASQLHWNDFWREGVALDLSNCTDPRTPELERRIVLSQYLTAIHCAGNLPSQETGLLCNSWYGKFHLEMHWWHSVHFHYWNRHPLFARSLPFYAKILDSARARAAQQGFQGARWPKMLGPDGADSPSSVGPLLIWQQPHPLYYAELDYRHNPTPETLIRWRDVVLATAEFMASYAYFDASRNGGGQYILGPCLRTVSENNDDSALNPTYELTAWRCGLEIAQKWLQRLGKPRNPDWDAILNKLAPAPTKDGLYLLHEGQDTFTKEWAWEHPAMLGALGVLPGNGIDPQIMAATVRKLRTTWDFSRIWGWDYPMAAMAAARTNQPDLAIDFLTLDAPTNRYLPNGCNFQRAGNDPVPAYFPGNAGLLAAIALMTAGWSSGPTTPNHPHPGFPNNGQWNPRAANFLPFLVAVHG